MTPGLWGGWWPCRLVAVRMEASERLLVEREKISPSRSSSSCCSSVIGANMGWDALADCGAGDAWEGKSCGCGA